MTSAPQFRIRSVLILTALVAIALLTLVQPSVVWLMLLPPLACILSVFAVFRAVTTPNERVFWASVLAGVAAFAFCVLLVELLSAVLGGPETVSRYIGGWAWQLMHSDRPLSSSGAGRFQTIDFVSFTVSLYLIAAVLFSAAATFVARLLMRDRNQGD